MAEVFSKILAQIDEVAKSNAVKDDVAWIKRNVAKVQAGIDKILGDAPKGTEGEWSQE